MTNAICYCCDEKFAPYAATSIYSARVNHEGADDYIFYVGYNELSDSSKRMLEKAASGAAIKFVKIDKEMFDNFRCEVAWISQAAAYRLLMPHLVDEDIKHLLYLDCDTLVMRDLSAVFAETEQHKETLGVVLDPFYKNYTQRVGHAKYFNSGVLLIDCEQWREKNYFEKVREALNHPENTLPDQDALNRVCGDDCFYMPLAYNAMVRTNIRHHYEGSTAEEYAQALKKPVVWHFIGRSKPWHTDYHTPLVRGIWNIYAKRVGVSSLCSNVQKKPDLLIFNKKAVQLPPYIEIDAKGRAFDLETRELID